MTDPLLEIRGLNVYYGLAHAVQDVDLEVNGHSLSLIGRNGMGKTTLCNDARRTRSGGRASATCPRVAGSSPRYRWKST